MEVEKKAHHRWTHDWRFCIVSYVQKYCGKITISLSYISRLIWLIFADLQAFFIFC